MLKPFSTALAAAALCVHRRGRESLAGLLGFARRHPFAALCAGAFSLCGAAAPPGCNGQLDPALQADANAIYAHMCVDQPGNPAVLTVINTSVASGAVRVNGPQGSFVAMLTRDCALGSPTSVAGAALWTVNLVGYAQKTFPNLKI